MAGPLVSVVMPSYNHEAFVAEAIGSLIDQSFEEWELVVTDDGSPDDTVEVIGSFDDPRIRLHAFDRNRGACSAMNDAISRARGRYVAVLNSDDAFAPHKLATQVEYLERHPDRAAVFATAEFIDENSELLAPGSHHYTNVFITSYPGRRALLRQMFFAGNCLCHPSLMIRAEVYRDVGPYDPRLAQLPDFDMWVRILLRGYEIEVLGEPLVQFRILSSERNASSRSVPALTRSYYEARLVMRQFFGIRDPAEFAAIFLPQDPAAARQLETQDLPVCLALLAAAGPTRLNREVGAEALFEAMAGDGAARLAERYGWTFADYTRLTGTLYANYAVAAAEQDGGVEPDADSRRRGLVERVRQSLGG